MHVFHTLCCEIHAVCLNDLKKRKRAVKGLDLRLIFEGVHRGFQQRG